MRELHVVAVSEDGRHVLLGSRRGSATTSYRVALDDRLLAAVRGDLPKPGEDPRAASALSPKEIQARLRAGETAEAIARSAGVPVTRVERFSGPVQGEMARVIDAARSAHLVRGRLGRSVLPLGRAVDDALEASPGLDPDRTSWQTHREPEGAWLVTVRWFARARLRSASWRYDPATREVVGVDPAASAMAHTVEEQPRKPAKRAAVTKAAAKAPRTKPPAKTPAKKSAVTKAAAKAPAAKAPAKTPAAKAPARKTSEKKTPAKKTATKKEVPTKAGARPGRALRVVPDAGTGRAAAERDGVKTRASVPAWADVLLGTTPGADR